VPLTEELNVDGMTGAEVTQFVVRQTRQGSPGAVKMLIPALRSLLRFLYIEGITKLPLAAAVLAPPAWKASSLPRPVDTEHVAALLASCDRRLVGGRRDYAGLKLLVRLGLRHMYCPRDVLVPLPICTAHLISPR
jgi:site-specific recombinase XerD